MESPAAMRLCTDLASARFLAGVADGVWKRIEGDTIVWPFAVFWVAAEARDKSPTGYHFKFDFTGYPLVPPTGTFWDPQSDGELAHGKRARGTGRVEKIFRVDWPDPNPGSALYYPYDRRGSGDHESWKREMPYWVWDEKHTIVDVLSVIHELLNSDEYKGVREAG